MTQIVKSNAVYDAIVNLLDTIAGEPDPLNRLVLFQYLGQQYSTRVLPERDRAAYDARKEYTIKAVGQATGVSPEQVYYWSHRHQERAGEPPLPRSYGTDVSGAVDLAGTLGMQRRRTRKSLNAAVVEQVDPT